jgi:Tol biopolymer transport system component
MRRRLLLLIAGMWLTVILAQGLGQIIPSAGIVQYVVRGAQDTLYLQDTGRPLRLQIRQHGWQNTPFWSPDRQTMVYLRRAAESLDFLVADVLSTQQSAVSIPLPPADEVDARFARMEWSPDSQHFAYVLFLIPRDRRQAPTTRVYVMSIGGEIRYEGPAQPAAFGSLYWSPDATALMELSRVNDNDGNFRLGMQQINVAQDQSIATDLTPLIGDINTGSGRWSPDSLQFALQGGAPEQLDRFVYLVESDGNLRQITDNLGLLDIRFLWSSDSTQLAAATPERYVDVIDVASTDIVYQVDTGPGTVAEPITWLPGDEGLVVSWLVKADAPSSTQYVGLWRGDTLTELGTFEGGVVDVAWSPDNTEVIFNVRDRSQWDLYWMGANDTEIIPLTEQGLVNRWVGWSVDGDWVLFQSDRTGDALLYIMRPDGTDARPISPAGEPVCCAGWWKE